VSFWESMPLCEAVIVPIFCRKKSTHGSYMKVPSAVKWFVFQIHEVGGLVTMQKRA
jgi:hypothetical protein